jgi:hypothetical protein
MQMLKAFMETILVDGSDINWEHVSKYFKDVMTSPITREGETLTLQEKAKHILKTKTKKLIKSNWAELKKQLKPEEIQDMNSWIQKNLHHK